MSDGFKSKIHFHDLRHIYSALFLILIYWGCVIIHTMQDPLPMQIRLDSLARWHEAPSGNNT